MANGTSQSAAQVEELAQVLAALTTPNTDTVRAAEARLKQITSAPACVAPLCVLSSNAPAAHTRQLACVLLRKAIKKHWDLLAGPDQDVTKAALLERLRNESDRAARRSLSSAAAAVCRAEGALWPDLSQTAVALAQSTDPNLRMGSYKILDAVADAVPGHLSPHAAQIVALLRTGLGDSVPDVRLTALDAYASTAEAVANYASEEEPWIAIGSLVPVVASVAQAAAQSVAQDTADDVDEIARILCVVFDIFDQLGESSGSAIMRESYIEVYQFSLQVSALGRMPMSARQSAVEYICSCLQNKPKTLRKAGLAKATLVQAVPMILNHYIELDDGTDESALEDDDDEINGADLGLRLAYTVSHRSELNRVAFTEVMDMAGRLMASDFASFGVSPSAKPQHGVIAAVRLLSAIAEGCSAQFTAHSEDVITRVCTVAATGAAPASCRGYAMESLALILLALNANEIDDDVRERCSKITLQAVLACMRDPSIFVRKNACVALEPVLTLFDDDGETLRVRAHEILQAIGSLGPEAAVEAVSAAAVIAETIGSEFVASDAYRGVVDGMAALMTKTAPSDMRARAAATHAAGSVVSECKNWEVAEKLAGRAITGFELEDADVREASFAFFSHLAQTHGGRVVFAFGERVLSTALTAIEREDVVFVPDGEEANAQGGDGIADADDDDEPGTYRVRTALLDEKTMAAVCIGAYAAAFATTEFYSLASAQTTDAARANVAKIVAHLRSSNTALDSMASYYHEEIRAASSRASVLYALAAQKTSTRAPSLAFAPDDCVDAVVARLLHMLEEDDDVMVVSSTMHATAKFVESCGVETLARHSEQFLRIINLFLDGEATCQIALEDDSDGGADEQDEGATYAEDPDFNDDAKRIIDGTCEVLSSLARGMRGHFGGHFRALLPKIQAKLLGPKVPPGSSALVVGMFADVMLFTNWRRCVGVSAPATDSAEYAAWMECIDEIAAKIVPGALAAARKEAGASKSLQRNACFLLGVTFQAVSPKAATVWGHVMPVMQTLEAAVRSGKHSNGALVDNAAGAVARIVTSPSLPSELKSNLKGGLQLALSVVPMDDDPVENTTLARALLYATQNGAADVLESHLNQALSCIVSAVLLSYEQQSSESSDMVGVQNDENDSNDYITNLDEGEYAALVDLLLDVRRRAGDACFAGLGLDAEDQSQLLALMAARA